MARTRNAKPAWQRRHQWLVGVIAAQAVLLGVLGTVDEGVAPAWGLVPALAVIPPAIVGQFASGRRTVVASTGALALMVQAIYTVVAFSGEAHGTVLLIAVLCAVALYEDTPVLIGTFVGLGAAVTGLAIHDPALLGIDPGDTERLVETLLFSFVASGLASVALVVAWRGHFLIRHIAAQQRRVTTAHLDVAGTMMFVIDRRGTVTVANRQTCLTLDLEEDEIVGQNWFDLALPAEHRAEARRQYEAQYDVRPERHVEPSAAPVGYENEVQTRDGSRRQVVWWGTLIHGRSGRPVGMACSGNDVTDIRSAHAELERHAVELHALRRLAQKVASLDDSRQAVVDAAVELAGASSAAILEPNRTRTELSVTTATREEFLGETIQLGQEHALSASAFLSGQAQFVPDCLDAPGANRRLVEAHGIESLLHQPIQGSAGVAGILSVLWEEPVSSLQERKAELVGLVAHEAAIALRRREALAQLERAALVDALTGVANRRAFDAELPAALRRAAEGNSPIGLIVLDLNEFKAVNDDLGHEAGDELLIASATAWADVLRAGDLLARLGGDEFAVLLPSSDAAQLQLIVSRLKEATPHGPGSSMGGVIWDGRETPTSLIRRADQAQYDDKAAMKREAGWPSRRDAGRANPGALRPRTADPRGDRFGPKPDVRFWLGHSMTEGLGRSTC